MFDSLKKALTKTSSKISSGISAVFGGKASDETLESVMECMVSADIGVKKAREIIQLIKGLSKSATPEDVRKCVKDQLLDIFEKCQRQVEIRDKPFVFLVSGANGNGKTTTIAKLANLYKQQGYKIRVAACDTYRAAAVGQLRALCDKIDIPVTFGNDGADPAAVAYAALDLATKNSEDILFVDTAGRLHNRSDLMDELAKIVRVIKKISPDAPHENLLIIDATIGQTGDKQIEMFFEKTQVSGLVVTKLDGTARGGVVISAVEKLGLPVLFLGFGEGVDDIKSFDAREYVESLIG